MTIPPHVCLTSESSKVSFEDLKTIAKAIDLSLGPLADAWDVERPRCDAVRGLTETHIRVSQMILTVKDGTDVENALGWHTEENGKVFGEIDANVLTMGGGMFSAGAYLALSSVISHEVFETLLNPNVNLWVDRGDGSTEDAREICDAVQGDAFIVRVRDAHGRLVDVDVSNYLLPAWFDAQNTDGPYDAMHLCKSPFEVRSNGYHVIRTVGTETAEDGTVKAVKIVSAIGNPALQQRALGKRRPRALHGLGPAFYVAPPAPEAPPCPEQAPEALAPTDPAPAPSETPPATQPEG